MNIILLSGGSGKRLWPLSNDIRSKQFLPLFKDENGTYESMLQRVYRQISSINPDAKITVATSKSQVGAILQQLGNHVSLSIEPCRRDTFPAIALAVAYLCDEMGVDEKECVAVCPVDPYVSTSYYKELQKMEKIVAEGAANLMLMGIEPSYPADKYGYIIPEDTKEVSLVRTFKEKPSQDIAAEYIREGALWNAGVFVFQMKYMRRKCREMTGFCAYQELQENYQLLDKISFDYAIVEKEPHIQVIRYKGEWKDVGTWSVMAEVMEENQKGNVILDETCENTQVINELEIPVLCMGCKNMIVAVSSEGILISDKEQSSYIKQYVEKIDEGIHRKGKG